MICDEYKFIFIHIPKNGGTSVRRLIKPHGRPQHRTALKHRKQFPKKYKSYSTFAFVRNPWARMVSQYFYKRKQYGIVRRKRNKGAATKPFDVWLKCRLNNPSKVHTQLEWLTDPKGRIIVDNVIKLEEVTEGWQELREITGFPFKLPHKNSTKHEPYTSYYDKRLVGLVKTVFAEDIKRLGYKFGE
jgi:hypothetical protein